MWKLWDNFVKGSSARIHILAPSELHVCLWLVFLKVRGLAPITIKTYLYSLSSEIKRRRPSIYHSQRFLVHPLHTQSYLSTTPCKGPVFRRPITVPVLKELLQALDFTTGDDLLYGVMVAVGVFGMFRINELCAVGRVKALKFIRNKDLTFHRGHASIKLYNTKTKQVVTKVLADIKGQPCNPCGLLWSLVMSKISARAPDGPLFINKKGKAVTRSMFIQFIRQKLGKIFPAINPQEWNGASLRKGGATSALKAGIPGELIAQLGHWDSDVYKRYMHCSIQDFTQAQASYAALRRGS